MTCMQQIVHPDARQADIAALLREKRSNKLIAKELGILHFTVRNHVTIFAPATGRRNTGQNCRAVVICLTKNGRLSGSF